MSIMLRAMRQATSRPFLKWAGGKQALAGKLVERFPANFAVFYEPFLGGGSVFFALAPKRSVLGDANGWLIDTFEAVRTDWRKVASTLKTLPNTKADFLRLRNRP